MSDNDYEIVDTSTIEFAGRSRKPKYTHKFWESDNPSDIAKYYASAHRLHCRRNKVEDSPYSHYVDKREEYVNLWLGISTHLINIEQVRLERENEITFTFMEGDE